MDFRVPTLLCILLASCQSSLTINGSTGTKKQQQESPTNENRADEPQNQSQPDPEKNSGAKPDEPNPPPGDPTPNPPAAKPPVWNTSVTQYSAPENTLFSIQVSATDPDTAGDPVYTLQPDLMTCDNAGFTQQIAIDANGTITGTPDFEKSQSCTIVVRATSGGDYIDLTITLTITDADDSPVWATFAPTAAATEDAGFTHAVLATDEDASAAITYAVDPVNSTCDDGVWTPALAIDPGTGAITGTPLNDDVGTCTLAINATSNSVTITNTVTITVANTNDAPLAVNDTVTAQEDTQTEFDVLANDTDVDVGDTLSIVSVSAATNGTTSVTAGNRIRYTPNPDYDGPDSFTYTMRDAAGLQSTATVSVTVNNVDPFFLADFGGNYKDILIEGNFAYVARGYQGIDIYDITQATPALVSNLRVGGYTFNLTKGGNYLYLGTAFVGLIIVDVTNPAVPVMEFP